jgi:hypothetical protein
MVNIENDWLNCGKVKVKVFIEKLLNFGEFWSSSLFFAYVCPMVIM